MQFAAKYRPTEHPEWACRLLILSVLLRGRVGFDYEQTQVELLGFLAIQNPKLTGALEILSR